MSRAQQEDIACPKCGLNQTVTFWTSINVTLDPELRQKLFAGEINVFRCSSCDSVAPLTVALMYHDMTRQYCAWYYPFSTIEDAKTLGQFSDDGKLRVEFPEMMAPMMPKYMTEPPVVFHPHELLRYIEFREALYALHHSEA